MENTIFLSTRHTFRLFILFLCFISISLHGMFTAPRRTQPVKRPLITPELRKEFEQKVRLIKIQDEKGQSIYIPENICQMSSVIKTALEFKKKQGEQRLFYESPVPVTILGNIFDIIKKKESIPIYEQIKNYSLDDVLPIVQSLDILAFLSNIREPFHYQTYLLSKQMRNVSPLVDFLNETIQENIFVKFVAQSLKNNIVKKTLFIDQARKTELTCPNAYLNKVIFSPNQKMIAVGTKLSKNVPGSSFLLYKIDEDGSINTEQQPQTIDAIQVPVAHLAFSPDSKSIALGCKADHENNLFLLKIGNDGIIEKEHQALNGHSSFISGLDFHPSGNAIVSTSIDDNGTVLLRTINADNTQTVSTLQVPDNMDWIEGACFNSDGTLLSCIGQNAKETKKNRLIIWEFNQDGTLKNQKPIVHVVDDMKYIATVAWFPRSKNCMIGGLPQNNNKSCLLLCDMSDIQDIKHKAIEDYGRSYHVQVSPDGRMIAASNDNAEYNFSIFTVQDDGSIILNYRSSDYTAKGNSFSFSADSNQIISFLNRRHGIILVDTLLTKEEQRIVGELKNLKTHQLLLIDRVLDGKIDLPHMLAQQKIPDEIMRLSQKVKFVTPPKTTLMKYDEMPQVSAKQPPVVTPSPVTPSLLSTMIDWFKKKTKSFQVDVKKIIPKE